MTEEKTPLFSRPVFSKELFDEETGDKFDKLPSWQRHLIKRVIDHGDLTRASHEAGVHHYVKANIDFKLAEEKSIRQALVDGGITSEVIVAHLWDCLEAKTVRLDKNGNPRTLVDHVLKLKTLELIAKMRGDLVHGHEKPYRNQNQITKKEVEELFESTNPD